MNVERFGVSYFSNINYEQINYINNKEYIINSLWIQILDRDNNLIDNNNWEIFLIIEYL